MKHIMLFDLVSLVVHPMEIKVTTWKPITSFLSLDHSKSLKIIGLTILMLFPAKGMKINDSRWLLQPYYSTH